MRQGHAVIGRRRLALIERFARSDCSFAREGDRWTGKCLICNGWLAFDRRDGVGVNVEHIRPRSAGGAGELTNLALTHPACIAEKGRHWDNRRARRHAAAEHLALLQRLHERRAARWRDPDAVTEVDAVTAPPPAARRAAS
jgi:5-methylcytosine-specific restriction endonuclease McrA